MDSDDSVRDTMHVTQNCCNRSATLTSQQDVNVINVEEQCVHDTSNAGTPGAATAHNCDANKTDDVVCHGGHKQPQKCSCSPLQLYSGNSHE